MMSNNSPSASDDVPVPPVGMAGVARVPSPAVAARRSPTSTPTSESGTFNASVCDWADVKEDENGNAAGILGYRLEELNVKDLRLLCAQLRIQNIRNVKKVDIIARIRTTFQFRKKYTNQQAELKEAADKDMATGAPRKQIQCPFRLLNILFSDEFTADFADLGNIASRQILDSGKAGNQQHFWERVSSAFIEDNETFGLLHFLDDEVLAAYSYIDPSKKIPHDWKKLRTIWKAVNADYKVALNKFTQSGTHDSDFFSFCNGKVEMYYLRKYLDLRPNLTATVEADLPVECAVSSEGFATTSTSGFSEKKKRVGNELAEALREYTTGFLDSELVKKKIRDMDEERMVKKQRTKMAEWTEIQATLRTMRCDLKNELLDDDDKKDLQRDIKRLVKLKNELADELGLD
jgi:hypothetical protein